jgi:hypothetical protein
MRRIVIGTAAILALLAIAGYRYLVLVDHTVMLVLKRGAVDIPGSVRAITTRVVRRCGRITNVGRSTREWQKIASTLASELQTTVSIRVLLATGDWNVAEAVPEHAEPGIFLLRATANGAEITEVWGGSVAPHRNAPMIRGYFESRQPTAPQALLDCYDPVGAPFTN